MILRLPAVSQYTGLSRSSLYLQISRGLFVKPFKLTERTIAWVESEVKELMQARISGKSDDEIRSLVQKLESDRKNT